MEGDTQTTLKLYLETREEAETTAAELRDEGFAVEVGRPTRGDWWSLTVLGDEDRVAALDQQLLLEIGGVRITRWGDWFGLRRRRRPL